MKLQTQNIVTRQQGVLQRQSFTGQYYHCRFKPQHNIWISHMVFNVTHCILACLPPLNKKGEGVERCCGCWGLLQSEMASFLAGIGCL